jgi:hypothetical protein
MKSTFIKYLSFLIVLGLASFIPCCYAQVNFSSDTIAAPSNQALENLNSGLPGYATAINIMHCDTCAFAKAGKNKPYDSTHTFRYESTGSSYLRSLPKVAAIQSLSLLFLFSSSKETTHWANDFGPELWRSAGKNLHTAWTTLPHWDNDPIITNYLQHPYAGSFYFNLVRNRGASMGASFAYAVIGSSIFEYFTEAMFEHPSTQDLIATPVIGSILGEATHQLTLRLSRGGFSIPEKVIVLIFNPAYVLNHGFRVPSAQRREQLQQRRRYKPANVFQPL